ncbi:20849_t:CDS:2, partial [Gigaspora margarita]
ITLRCIVEGEISALAFPVNVNKYTNIYTLSKSIFEKIIVPKNNDLVLWKLEKSSSVEKIFNHECEKLSDISKPIHSIFEFPLKEKNIHIIVSFEELMWMKINDVEVYTKTWKAKNEPKAYITFLHSYVDHIGFYDHIFSKFKDNNIEVNAFDQCGH